MVCRDYMMDMCFGLVALDINKTAMMNIEPI